MTKDQLDPEYRYALREAGVILIVFVAALIYTVTFCYGFDHEVDSIRLYWGIPGWVMWGIVVPWIACAAFTTWFCFGFMKEGDPGGPESGDEVPRSVSSSPPDEERPDAG